MIRIGLNHQEKQKVIKEYLTNHDIRQVKVFYYKRSSQYDFGDIDNVEYIEWSDIIMYKYFYRLLEEIDGKTLIIIDELMRTKNRNDLTYNCAHHYLNQTPHRIIFEFLPIIDDIEDFMILLNYENKDKYKGKSFNSSYLLEEDIQMKPYCPKLEVVEVDVTDEEIAKYEKEKHKVFHEIESSLKDPDIIPRRLQIVAGDFKKKAIAPDKRYVARNKRFNLENVYTYDDIWQTEQNGDYIVIDMHYNRLNFNDFLKVTNMDKICYLSTPLSIDKVIIDEFMEWKGVLNTIYAQASIYR